MEEKRNQTDHELNQENIFYCSRCKVKEAEITCAMCDPFKYFCNNCNEYVHSVPSKKFHVRRKIQDKLLESVNNNALSESKLKTSNSSNFILSDNFNKEKFSRVIKDKQFEIKKALENFEFNYSNNRFYNNNNNNNYLDNNYSKNYDYDSVNINNNNNINDFKRNLNSNYEEDNKADTNNNNNNINDNNYENNNYNQKIHYYNSTKEIQTSNNQEFERLDRGRLRENQNYGTHRPANNNNNNNNLLENSRNFEKKPARNNYSNNSLRGSYEEIEKGFGSKSRDNSRRFYNFRRNNTNQENSFSKSPKANIISNNDLNVNIGSGNNYINEIKVNLIIFF